MAQKDEIEATGRYGIDSLLNLFKSRQIITVEI